MHEPDRNDVARYAEEARGGLCVSLCCFAEVCCVEYRMSNKLKKIYLLLVGIAMFLVIVFPPPGRLAYLSVYGLLMLWGLTLPWSLIMVLFAWTWVHDAQNLIFLLMFTGCAALNVYFFGRDAKSQHQ